jgi:ArsR family transcriptional regulator
MSDGSTKRSCRVGLSEVLSPGLFKALCDPNRLQILGWLAERGEPSAVGDVAACCSVDLSVVSRHLAMLRDAGVLEAHKKGRHVLYSVRGYELARLLRNIADCLDACCPPKRPRTAADQADGKTNGGPE